MTDRASGRSDDATRACVEQFARIEDALPGGPRLAALRRRAIARFAEAGFPTSRIEDWKYTNLARLGRLAFSADGEGPQLAPADLAGLILPTTECYRYVFVNGHFAPALSHAGPLPEGVTVSPLAAAAEADDEAIGGENGALSRVNGEALVALNTAMTRDGLVVRIARHARPDRPIHCLHVAAGTAGPVAVHPRTLVRAEEGAEATVIESFAGAGGAAGWTNAVTDIEVGEGASVSHLKLQEEDPGAYHVGFARVRLARDGRYDALVLGTGAALSRSELRIALEGEGASCRLRGASLVRGRQHADITTEIDHRVPHGTSAQLFKNVIDDRARSVFQGRVIVQPGAQKTDAHQTNRNLLLSRRGQADTKPELRIFADDVKCSHGATVGELDKAALFYLLSRGIDPEAARSLLVEAFASEVVDELPEGALREDVRARVASWLAAGEEAMERAA